MSKARVIVTGGTGYVGEALVRELCDDGIESIYTYRKEPIVLQSNAEFTRGISIELTSPEDFKQYRDDLHQVTCLIHTAALVKHYASPSDDIRGHLGDSSTMLANLIGNLPNLKKIIYISSTSAAIADTDRSFYGLGKLVIENAVEHYAKVHGLDYVLLRFPQIYGPNEPHGTFITKFLDSMAQGKVIEVENDGAVVRDVIYIKDVVGAIKQAMQTQKSGLFTITPTDSYSVAAVLDKLIKVMGMQPEIHNSRIEDTEIKNKSFHCESTAADLGYNLRYSLEEGLREMKHAKENN